MITRPSSELPKPGPEEDLFGDDIGCDVVVGCDVTVGCDVVVEVDGVIGFLLGDIRSSVDWEDFRMGDDNDDDLGATGDVTEQILAGKFEFSFPAVEFSVAERIKKFLKSKLCRPAAAFLVGVSGFLFGVSAFFGSAFFCGNALPLLSSFKSSRINFLLSTSPSS